MPSTGPAAPEVDVVTGPGAPPADEFQRRIGRSVGHVVAAGVNLALLWTAHQLLGWGWPRFLTEAFDDVLPLLSVSLVASAVAELIFVVHDRGRFRPFADLVTGVLSLAVAWRLWQVYPFDFSSYAHDWSWLASTVLWVGILGTAVAVVVNAAKLVRRLLDPGGG